MVTGADAAWGAAPWSAPEDAVIIAAQARFGNKWMSVAALLPGRTANAIKTRWNATLLPRLRRQAASPQAASSAADASPLPLLFLLLLKLLNKLLES